MGTEKGKFDLDDGFRASVKRNSNAGDPAKVKAPANVGGSRPMVAQELERCENCGRELGRLENDVWRDCRVCRPCWEHLSGRTVQPPSFYAPPPAPPPSGPSVGAVVGSYVQGYICLVGFLVSGVLFVVGAAAVYEGAWLAILWELATGAVMAMSIYGMYRAIQMSRPRRPEKS